MLERVALLLLLLAVGAASLEIEVDDPVGAAAVKAAAEAEASRGFAGTFSTLQRPPELATSRTQKNMTSLTHATKPPHLQADVIDMDLANGIAGMHALGTGSEETSMREIAIVCVALVLVVAILCTQTSVVDEKFLQEQKLEARRTR